MAPALGAGALWGCAAVILFAHQMLGIPGGYIARGDGLPEAPTIPLTVSTLAIRVALATLPIFPMGYLALRFGWVLFGTLAVVALWLLAAEMETSGYAGDFGTTWARFEPLRELFLHPLHTPVALAVLGLAAYALLARCGRAR